MGGNLLTNYRYRKCTVLRRRTPEALETEIATPGEEADLSLCARVDRDATAPPAGSPFRDLATARRFAGPLPYTFDPEAASDRMVVVEGVRENWTPKPVHVDVARCTFVEKPPFALAPVRLANAFLVENVPYRWKRGVVLPVTSAGEGE